MPLKKLTKKLSQQTSAIAPPTLMAFIEQSNKAKTIDELVEAYSKAIGYFGFNRFDYSLMSASTHSTRKNAPDLLQIIPKAG